MESKPNVLPHDETLENALLAGVISYPDEFPKVESYISNGHVLYQYKAKALWRLIKRMRRDGEEVSMPTVCASISAKDENEGLNKYYVIDITNEAPLSMSIEPYARKVYEQHLLREIINSTHKIQQDAYDNKTGVYEEIISAHTHLGELISFKPSQKFDIESEMGETINAIQDKESKLIKTGFEGIDTLAGGLTRGEITVIGGRPGHGKTTFIVNLLANMIGAGYKCVLFNRELPNSELLKKLIALESGRLSYSMIRKGIYDETGILELEKIKQFIVKKYNSKVFRMFDNLRDFAKSSAEVKRFKPDVILDDYIQLINPTKQIEQRRLQLEALVNDYKWLAKEHKAVVVLASQLNRGLEMRSSASKPQLSDLAESGAIEQVAENVFFTYYDYKINGNANKGKNIITIVARKVRYGETGEIDLGFDGDKARFYNTVEALQEDMKRDMKVKQFEEDLPF
jgi:replicative DNA helicase